MIKHDPCGLLYDTAEALSRHSRYCPQTSHSLTVNEHAMYHDPCKGTVIAHGRRVVRTGANSHSQQPDYDKQMVEGVTRSACAGVHSELGRASLTLRHGCSVKHTARKGINPKIILWCYKCDAPYAAGECPCYSGASQ